MKERNIICISASEWGGDYAKTIVEISKELSQENRVLYVDYPFTYKDLVYFIFKGDLQSVFKIIGLHRRLRKIDQSGRAELYLFVPPLMFPVNFLGNGWLYSSLLKLNGIRLSKAVKRVIGKLEMAKDLIYINAFMPSLGEVTAGRLNEKTLIYYCYDEINAAKWLKKHGGRHELNFMNICDGVFTTSEGLFLHKQKFTKKCFLIKNAVNINLFKKGVSDRVLLKNKIIGYIGSVDDRLDYVLLEFLLTQYPDYTFEFIGRCNYSVGRKILEKYPNVKIYGPRKVEELPEFISRFSVGIIPFSISEFNAGIYPLKINEYLAGGLPVVMSCFAKLDEFREVAYIANDQQEFSKFLQSSILSDSYDKQRRRVEFASKNSWAHRVNEISDAISIIEND